MTRGREGSRAGEHLVHRAVVDATLGLNAVALGDEPDDRHLCVELLGNTVVHDVRLVVPSSTLHEHTIHVGTIIRFLSNFILRVVIDNLEVEVKFIDGDEVLSGEVLQQGCEVGLREDESRDPDGGGCALVDPLLPEVSSLDQLHDPRRKRLQRQETFAPLDWHLVVEETRGCLFQILGHDKFTNEGLLNVDQGRLHGLEEPVVLEGLLCQHRILRLVVVGGILLNQRIEVK